MNNKDNQEAERKAFEELKFIDEKLRQSKKLDMSKVYGNWFLKHEKAIRATLTTPQVNGEVASGEATRLMFPLMLRKMWSAGEVQAWLDENYVAQNTATYPQQMQLIDLADFADSVKQLCRDFSSRTGNVYIKDVESAIDGLLEQHTNVAPTPSPSNVLVEALRKIEAMSHIGSVMSAKHIAHQALATYSSTDSVSISKAEYEAMKADAEQYKKVKDILCNHEGLSLTLEYRKGDEKFSNRKVFTETEIQASPFLEHHLKHQALKLWNEIDTARKSS